MNASRPLLIGITTLVLLLVDISADAAPVKLDPALETQNEAVAELYSAGRYAEGIELVHKYLAQWSSTAGTGSPEYCSMASNLGPLLTESGDMEAAGVAHREGLACLRRIFGPESEDLASALNNYGSFLGLMADLGRAELALKESLRLLRLNLGEDHIYVAITLNNLGVNQQNQGNYVAAEKTMREAVARLRANLGDEHNLTATAVNNLGRLLGARGDFDEAELLLREALATRLAQAEPDPGNIATGRRDLGRLLWREGRFAAAESYLREALASFVDDSGPESLDVAMSRHDLGRVLVDLKRYDEAETELTSALDISEQNYAAGHASRIQIQEELGELAFVRGRLPEARDRLEAATTEFEQGRERSGEGLSRATYLDSPWYSLAAVCLELGDSTGAWQALEMAQGRVLAEKLGIAKPATSEAESLEAGTAIIGWLDVELAGEARAWAWSLRQDGVHWHQLDSLATHAEAIAVLREDIAVPGSLGRLRGRAFAVWQHRVAPLAEDLGGVTHVVVVPSGGMLGVPVAALVDDESRWLADRWSLSYAPSVGVYRTLRAGDRRGVGPALFVGDPELAGAVTLALNSRRPSDDVIRGAAHGLRESLAALPPLPGTRDEVQGLAAGWPGSSVLLGPEASEANLSTMANDDELSGFRVLHFATHALVDSEDAGASALVLCQTGLPDPLTTLETGERVFDGLVTTREIVQQWHLDADLVTLSACNSALGRAVTGEGLVGFAHAFLQVGARATLVSQWSVPDRATMLFMKAFYGAWRGGDKSLSAALVTAQHALREHQDQDGRLLYEDPYYWAPFVLVGNDR